MGQSNLLLYLSKAVREKIVGETRVPTMSISIADARGGPRRSQGDKEALLDRE